MVILYTVESTLHCRYAGHRSEILLLAVLQSDNMISEKNGPLANSHRCVTDVSQHCG